MPRSLPVALRKAIQRRQQRGQSPAAIAAALDLSVRTVRALLQRWRQSCPDDALQPSYVRCGPQAPRTPAELVQTARQLRREHPTWGAPLIRVFLQQEFPAETVPTARTIQRWLREHELPAAPAGRPPGPPPGRVRQPHAVWQMDAAEQVPLRWGQRVSWLRLSDEATGAVLQTVVFPPRGLAAGRSRRGAKGFAPSVCPLGATAHPAGG